MSTSSLRVNGVQYPDGTNAPVVVNVKDPAFGAKGDGVADDTAAIQAAITKANALLLSGNSGIYGTGIFSGTMPTVFLPNGVYKVTSALTSHSYIRFKGDRSIIVASSDSNDILTAVSFNTTIEGITFRRGRYAVSIATGNIDTTTIIIRDCEFIEQQGASIYSDATSNSTMLRIESSKFSDSAAGANVVQLNSIDYAVMENCWVSAGTTNVFQINGGRLFVRDMVGVPQNSTGRWFNVNGGTNVEAYRSRFGGENGGKTIVTTHTGPSLTFPENPTTIVIRDCEAYSSVGNAFEFYDLPNTTIIEGNHGFTNTPGLYFDAAIPTSTLNALGGWVQFRIDPTQSLPIPTTTSNGDALSTAAALLSTTFKAHEYLSPDRVLMHIPFNSSGYAKSTVTATMTTTTDTDEWGHARINYTSTSNGANTFTHFTTAMNSWPTGIYTMVAQIEVVNGPIDVTVPFGLGSKTFTLNNGKHVIDFPFAWGTAFNQTLGLDFYGVKNTASFNVSDIRLFKGVVDVKTSNTVVYSSSLPVNGGWRVGDRVETTTPTAGGATGFVCTTAGWAVKEAWTTGHTYAIGDQVSAGGNVYVAKTAGVAGASAPTGTATGDISDGTVTWRYVATSGLATFSPLPSVTLADAQALTNKTLDSTDTLTSVALAGTMTGTYTLGGTPTITGGASIANKHYAGTGTAPTIAVGVVAQLGTGPSASILAGSTDASGIIQITTGTTPTAFTTSIIYLLGTVTFNSAYGAIPKGVILTVANGNAGLKASGGTTISFYVEQSSTTTTTFTVSAICNGAPTLAASTVYQFSYNVIQ